MDDGAYGAFFVGNVVIGLVGGVGKNQIGKKDKCNILRFRIEILYNFVQYSFDLIRIINSFKVSVISYI